jgi:catechol 2,3-dioxygenase-like lactoylglutathione lyase family enzyme
MSPAGGPAAGKSASVKAIRVPSGDHDGLKLVPGPAPLCVANRPGLPRPVRIRPARAFFTLGDMAIQRMDNVAIVVDDLDAAVAFFAELGMELEGKAQVEGRWADRTVGLDGVRSDIAMMRTPDGHSKLELTRYHTPAAPGAEPQNPPPNTLGLHRVMFAVDDIDDTVARLRALGAELLGEVAQYESIFRLCYLRGPAGIIVALAEQIG